MSSVSALLACIASLVPVAVGDPPEDSLLRTRSLVVKEGIRGGFIPPLRHRTVVLGYDWNRGTFRGVEERRVISQGCPTRSFRAADIDPRRFRELCERVIETGLPDLPLEDPPGCTDLYGRGTGIAFLDGGEAWENRAPDGCVSSRSSVAASAEQVGRFGTVLDLIESTVAELPFEPASALDSWEPRPWTRAEVDALARALESLDELGFVNLLDANRATFEEVPGIHQTVRFPWRSAQPYASVQPPGLRPTGSCTVRVWRTGTVELLDVEPFPFEDESDLARRRAFIEANPSLTHPHRALIAAGWLEGGMTEAMVLASWGEPDSRSESSRDAVWSYERGTDPSSRRGRVDLRFRDGRLLARP